MAETIVKAFGIGVCGLGSWAAICAYLYRDHHKPVSVSLHDHYTQFFGRLLRRYGSVAMMPVCNFEHVSSYLDRVNLSSFKEGTIINMIDRIIKLIGELNKKDAIIGALRDHLSTLKELIMTNKKDSLLVTQILTKIMEKLMCSFADYSRTPIKMIFTHDEYLVEAIIQPQVGDVSFAIKFRLYQLVGDYDNLFEMHEIFDLSYEKIFHRTPTWETQCGCLCGEVCQTCGSLFFPFIGEDGEEKIVIVDDIAGNNPHFPEPHLPNLVSVLSYEDGKLERENVKFYYPETPADEES
jgi:hypothetical protein